MTKQTRDAAKAAGVGLASPAEISAESFMPTPTNSPRRRGRKAIPPMPALAVAALPSVSNTAEAVEPGHCRVAVNGLQRPSGLTQSPRKRGRRGLKKNAALCLLAAPEDCGGNPAGEGQCHPASDGRLVCALSDLIGLVIEAHRVRRSLLVAEGDMERRIKSKERSFAVARLQHQGVVIARDKFPPVTDTDRLLVAQTYPAFFTARDVLAAQRAETDKELVKLARQLPIYAWAKEQRGISELSIAAIVGEAGDLGNYSNVGKLWKRMGLAVFDGERQRKHTDAAKAAIHGYSPSRRSQMFVIGDNMIKAGLRNPKDPVTKKPVGETAAISPWGQLYLDRRAYEVTRDPEIKPIVAHRRAKRYMEKRLLREAWRAWRGGPLDPSRSRPLISCPPSSEFQEAAE